MTSTRFTPRSPGRRRFVRAIVAMGALQAIVVSAIVCPVPAFGSAAAHTFSLLKCANTRAGYAFDMKITANGVSGVIAADSSVQKVDVRPNPARVLGTTTAAWGENVTLHPNGLYAYVASSRSNTVFVVNISASVPRVVGRITVGSITDAQVSPNGNLLYVTTGTTGGAALRVYSLASPSTPKPVGRSLRLPYSPRALAVAPSGRSAAITLMYSQVALVSLANPTSPVLISRVPVPFTVNKLVYSRGSGTVFAGGEIRPQYAVINVNLRRVTSYLTISGISDRVTGLDVSSDNTLLWLSTASTGADHSVYAFDMASSRSELKINGLDAPGAIAAAATGPTRGRIYFPALSEGYLCVARQTPN